MVRDPAPREVGKMDEDDRRRFVHVALDAARERLRAYRLLCTAAKAFYAQRHVRDDEGGPNTAHEEARDP